MLLQEVFDQLACAELNNISVVDQASKMILPEEYGKVATAINAGLTQLHTRFLLRKGIIKVHVHEDREVYELTPARMATVAEGITVDRYIERDATFRGDLLKINGIRDECGHDLPINQRTRGYSVAENNYNTIQLVPGHHGCYRPKELLIEYRQNHKMIPAYCDGLDPESYGLTLPRTHLWALCLFVAGRMHYPVGLQDATYSGNSFMALFNSECDRLDFGGFQLQESTVNEGIRLKGFP